MNKYQVHVGKHRRKYGLGAIAAIFLAAQLIWDIAANVIANYVQPLAQMVFGDP